MSTKKKDEMVIAKKVKKEIKKQLEKAAEDLIKVEEEKNLVLARFTETNYLIR